MSKNQESIQNIALEFIKNRNNETFSKIVNRLRPGLLSFAYKYVKDRDLSNEVVSQTFIIVWEKINQYNSKFKFSTWVYAIARNEALGILKGKNKTLSLDKYTDNHSHLLQMY